MRNDQPNIGRRKTTPVPYPRTRRPDFRALNTSARAGKVMPAAFIPLNPEDGVQAGSDVRVMVQMEPTEKMLANAVHVRVHAYFVSYAALERFDGMDSVAFAWAGRDGAPALDDQFIYSDATDGEFYHAFGEHIADGESVNSLYHRAYNAVVNFRRQQVSISLPERLETDTSLARAMWGTTAIARVVPDFDSALIQASTELTFSGEQLAVSGSADLAMSYVSDTETFTAQDTFDENGTKIGTSFGDGDGAKYLQVMRDQQTGEMTHGLKVDDFSNVFAELSGGAGSISIAKIDQARELQRFADMRRRMAGTDDDLIDLLMRGIQVPRHVYHNPLLIGQASGVIGMSQRYATDAANLEDYVAQGTTAIRVPLLLPKQETGGCVVVTYEIVPEPVFDRQADLFLRDRFADYPHALRDFTDVQPVDVVPNRFVDALHTQPDGTFGYAPLNYKWARRRVGVGGRFLRTLSSDASDEDQQHIWSVRQVDPVLDEDAFLVPDGLAHNVFRDTLADPFFVRVQHDCVIEGITQFGPALYESSGDYDAVVAEMDDETIVPGGS